RPWSVARSAELEEAGFDDGVAEGAGEFGETFAVAVTQGGVGGKCQEVGAVLDVPAQAYAFRAEGVTVEEASRAQALLGVGPRFRGPCAARLEEVDGNLTGGSVQNQGFQASDALAQQARHVAVTAEFPEQRLGVP